MTPRSAPPHGRLLILSDRPGSITSHVAEHLAVGARRCYEVDLGFTALGRTPDASGYDMVHSMCWWDDAWRRAGVDPARVVVHVFSEIDETTGWSSSQAEMASRGLAGTGLMLVSDPALLIGLKGHGRARRLDVGVDPSVFHPAGRRYHEAPSVGIVSGALASGVGDRLARDAAPEDRLSFFRSHDMIVVTGNDAWSQVCRLEAMACGAFVIASRRAKDLLANGVNGLVVEDAEQEILAAIDWVRRDPGVVAEGGAIAAQEAMTGFNWNLVGDSYIATLWGHLCRIGRDEPLRKAG